MSGFARFASGLAEGFKAARYYEALKHMNDRQLADIGTSREAIGRRVFELAQKR